MSTKNSKPNQFFKNIYKNDRLKGFVKSCSIVLASSSVALATVLGLYNRNFLDVAIGEAVLPVLIALLTSIFLYLIFIFFTKDRLFSVVAVMASSIFLTKFENFFIRFKDFIDDFVVWSTPYDYQYVLLLLFLFLALGILIITLIKKKLPHGVLSKFRQLLKFFVLASVIFTSTYIVQIAIKFVRYPDLINGDHTLNSKISLGKSVKPDIYYFIFDRYANNDTLQKYYNYDNSEFKAAMEKRGFVFNKNTHSNYPYTATSLSSTFNSSYLNSITEDLPGNYSELFYRRLIANNNNFKTLQENGYTYYHSGSWWGTTRTNPNANYNFVDAFSIKILGKKYVTTDFQDTLLEGTIFRRLFAARIPLFSRIIHYEKNDQRQIVNYQLGAAKELVQKSTSENIFGLFHILSPHPQYVFDAEGNVPSYHPDPKTLDVPESVKYVNQLKYINTRILETVDYIIQNSDTEPIIVFQTDEGPYLFDCNDFSNCSWNSTDEERWQWKFGVLSAKKKKKKDTRYDVTPVNLFPYLFNTYFNTSVEYQ
ncbi:hypothetical protein KC959_00655, partial [Candidatus Saccharibacteria bacterium]|nr:hypothetical protein [Candidatus Saccharibacteria bacterium]